ncbi:hypothetical protein FRX31_034126, partial [Thalictrum thalictroides]
YFFFSRYSPSSPFLFWLISIKPFLSFFHKDRTFVSATCFREETEESFLGADVLFFNLPRH